MKKLIISLIIISAIVSCKSKKEYEELEAQKARLEQESNVKDSLLNEFVTAFNEFDDNLQKIKEKEEIITMETGRANEVNATMKEKINSDIEAIYDLMLRNKETIEDLREKMKRSGVENSKLNTMIASLNRQLRDKGSEVLELKNQLETKNIQIQDLNFTVEGLAQTLDSLKVEKQRQMEALQMQKERLQTVFYVFGNRKELKDHNIIDRDGLFSKLEVMQGKFDTTYLTRINKYDVQEIQVNASRLKILSRHPEKSYQVKDSAEIVVLTITDPDEFWKTTKYLVGLTN